jgi:hypothetical protein
VCSWQNCFALVSSDPTPRPYSCAVQAVKLLFMPFYLFLLWFPVRYKYFHRSPFRRPGCIYFPQDERPSFTAIRYNRPIPVAERSTARFCGHLLTGIVGSNAAGGMDVCRVLCCLREVCATSWSLVQRSPTDCGVSVCDPETTRMRRSWSELGCCARERDRERERERARREICKTVG